MLTALGTIATQQDAPTHPDAIITLHASDMVLAGHSDASHLSESKE